VHALLNSMRFQGAIGQNLNSQTRIGLVTSYNPDDCTVKVSLQPEDADAPGSGQTGWIPLATSFYGLVGAPNIDDQVIVVFQEGSLNSGIVVGKIYSGEDVPPSVPAGEWWIVHPSGSFIKIKNDGDVDIAASGNININCQNASVNASASAVISSPAINLSNGGSLQSLVNAAFENLYNNHTHGGGAPPDRPYQMTGAELTSVLKAQ